jgi:hypothetical protein
MMADDPDVGFEKPSIPQSSIPQAPYSYGSSLDDMKPWYQSRTVWSAIASFGLYILKHLGIIDWANEMIVQVQGFIVTIGLVFSRVGNKRIVSSSTYKNAKKDAETPPTDPGT